MGTHYSPKIPTENLMFSVDFGNPKFNGADFINKVSYTTSSVTVDTTKSSGYVQNSSGGYLEFNSSKFSTYDMSNGFSAIIICSIANFDNDADQTYRGIIGTGNSFTDRLINLWFQKTGSDIRLHQSANNTTNTGYVGSFSSTFTPPSTNEIIMVGYSHNAVDSVTYYLHGRPLSTNSSLAAIRTTWPSRNDLYISSVNDANAFYYTGGRIYTVLLYNKFLTSSDHLSCFNSFKNRFDL